MHKLGRTLSSLPMSFLALVVVPQLLIATPTNWWWLPLELAGAFGLVAMMVFLSVRPGAWSKRNAFDIPNVVAFVGGLLSFVATFAWIYATLAARSPASFNKPLTRIDAAYFALTTFTTTGFGDILPVSQSARLVVSVQMCLGVFIVIVGIGRAASVVRRSADK